MNDYSPEAAAALARAVPQALPKAERTLADQLAAWLRVRIDEHALKPGTRLRHCARERGGGFRRIVVHETFTSRLRDEPRSVCDPRSHYIGTASLSCPVGQATGSRFSVNCTVTVLLVPL